MICKMELIIILAATVLRFAGLGPGLGHLKLAVIMYKAVTIGPVSVEETDSLRNWHGLRKVSLGCCGGAAAQYC